MPTLPTLCITGKLKWGRDTSIGDGMSEQSFWKFQQQKNANIAYFVLPLPLEIN